MRVNKLSELWVIFLLGILILFKTYFSNENFALISK